MKTYNFRVSLPGIPDVWRTIEMRGDQTLEDLHLAIQHAYDFDNDHMYSFFMSGRAWDHETEYSLPEGEDPWSLTVLDGGPLEDEAPAESGEDGGEDDASESELAGMVSMLSALGVPPDTVQSLQETMRDDSLAPQEKLDRLKVALGPVLGPFAGMLNNFTLDDSPEDEEEEDEEPAGDVRTTTIDELNLRPRKKFLYLFDYGDQWHFDVRVQGINPNGPEGEYPHILESVGEAPAQYDDLEDDEDEDWDEDDLDGEDADEEGDAE